MAKKIEMTQEDVVNAILLLTTNFSKNDKELAEDIKFYAEKLLEMVEEKVEKKEI